MLEAAIRKLSKISTWSRHFLTPGVRLDFPHSGPYTLHKALIGHWLTKPDVLRLNAEKVLAAPFDPRETSQQLQRLLHFDTARACIRLISLLEKARSK